MKKKILTLIILIILLTGCLKKQDLIEKATIKKEEISILTCLVTNNFHSDQCATVTKDEVPAMDYVKISYDYDLNFDTKEEIDIHIDEKLYIVVETTEGKTYREEVDKERTSDIYNGKDLMNIQGGTSIYTKMYFDKIEKLIKEKNLIPSKKYISYTTKINTNKNIKVEMFEIIIEQSSDNNIKITTNKLNK
jgi:hypothetical protein